MLHACSDVNDFLHAGQAKSGSQSEKWDDEKVQYKMMIRGKRSDKDLGFFLAENLFHNVAGR